MKKKRLLSVMIAITMVLSLMPAMAFAEDTRDDAKRISIQDGGYKYSVAYPDATAAYITIDGRQLEYDAIDDDENSISRVGDRIIISYKDGNLTQTKTYTYTDTGDFYEFLSDDGDSIYFYFYIVNNGNGLGEVWGHFYYYEEYGDYDYYTFDINTPLPEVKITTDVKAISFSPASIRVNSEDVKSSFDGTVEYDFYKRALHTAGGISWRSPFAVGDRLTVTYTNGTTRTYVNADKYFDYDGYNDYFVYGDEMIWPVVEGDSLKSGNNKVLICYHGVSTAIDVFMDTPSHNPANGTASSVPAADTEWTGTIGSIPAAKSVKAKAAKKAVKVSWKKATKKKAKKFDKVEIQVCPDKNFQRSNTKRIEVKKSKKSAKVKGLSKKTTYYVRVRDVKGSGTGKIVSKWSKIKKVKTK